MATEDPLCNRDCFEFRPNPVNLTKSVIAGIGLATLLMSIFAVAAGIINYSRLKSFYAQYNIQENDIAGLSEKLSMRNEQLEKISGKLQEMETRLTQLGKFEKNIRNIAGVGNSQDPIPLFGIGGEIPGDIESEDENWQNPENVVQYLDDRFDRIDDAVTQRSESLQALYDILKTQEELLAVTPCIRPVEGGWVASGFGYRNSPFNGQREFHSGIDIAVRPRTKVKATADGVVIFAGKLTGLGRTVEIDHGFGIVSRYGHLNRILTSKKQEIKKGDTIAESGNTGRSTGPHLHYEIRFNGIPLNAEKYMAPYLAENVSH